jgi:hypothetical protein
VAAARRVNEALAWMFTARPAQAAQQGLANCAWLLDDGAAAGGLACVHHGRLRVAAALGLPQAQAAAAAAASAAAGRRALQQQQPQQAGPGRRVLLPANPALLLRVFGRAGEVRREVRGSAGQAQLLDLSAAAQDVQLLWTGAR